MCIISCVQGHINHKQQRQSSHPVMISLFPPKKKEKEKEREEVEEGQQGGDGISVVLVQFSKVPLHFPKMRAAISCGCCQNKPFPWILSLSSYIGQSGHERNLLSLYLSCIIVSTALQMMFLGTAKQFGSLLIPTSDHSGSCGPSSAPSCQNNQSVS